MASTSGIVEQQRWIIDVEISVDRGTVWTVYNILLYTIYVIYRT